MSRIDGHYYDVMLLPYENKYSQKSKKAFLKVIEDDYLNTLNKLVELDKGNIYGVELFEYILNLYIRNLKDLSYVAKLSKADDLKLSDHLKVESFYKSEGLDFFRIKYLTVHEAFIKNNGLIKTKSL